MIIRKLTPDLAVADQLTLGDLDAVKDAGFKAVVCNRPDEEGETHAGADAMAKKANTLGLEFRYLPVNSGNITDRDVKQHAAILAEVPAPVLTYCRSGTRCAKLWALAEAGKWDVTTLIETVDKAGLSIVDIAYRL
ncbi:MAG: TIGR01244 family phosphatase [Gammaproteobacteria bacterium]|nr:TIGR01244 family phosphatase [Gammaproteobacteria bacterium]HAN80028.1 TIGR01244 family phosphatase [Gammaproteobacteria bacterium]